MKASKFSESQIAFVLRQGEEDTQVEENCRKTGISQATYYNWKKEGGLLPSEMKWQRQIEGENSRLRRMSYRQILVTAGPVKRRRLRLDGRAALR